ncbi:MAG: acyl carrier protein [Segniliparus sp.]|uniref:acyl carrier protein n=1 Tax=Segniliparus sp. TaxID=2804064 RepID=UPI003F3C594E
MQTANAADTEKRVRSILEKRFGEAAVLLGADVALAEGLPNFDSLAGMEFITAVEEEFDIEVDFVDDDVRYSFSTLDRVVEYIAERVEDQG